jgi:hypothetical protein
MIPGAVSKSIFSSVTVISTEPEDKELIASLTSPRGELRARGLEALRDSNRRFDDLTLVGLLRHKFSDPDRTVRRLAAQIAEQRKLKGLSNELIALLNGNGVKPTDVDERVDYIRTLGEISSSESSQVILEEIRRCNGDVTLICTTAMNAAKRMNDLAFPREATRNLSGFWFKIIEFSPMRVTPINESFRCMVISLF